MSEAQTKRPVISRERMYQTILAPELIPAVDQRHMAAAVGQKQRVLQGGVTAAYHRHITAGVEGAVAHGAVGHAAAHQLLLAVKTQMAVSRTGSQHHRRAALLAAGALHGKALAVTGKPRDLVVKDLHAQRFHLLGELLGKIRAG